MVAEHPFQFDECNEHFRTAIIATLGPASSGPDVLGRLVDAGASMFRLNFSHGTLEEHGQTLKELRAVSHERDVPVAVLGDLSGPKIRLVKVEGDGVELQEGMDVIFDPTCTLVLQEEPTRLGCSLPRVLESIEPGQRVLIDDGHVRLRATGCSNGCVQCSVETGGRISTHKGINLPDSGLMIDMPTEADRACAAWAIEQGLDWLAMSFVRTAADIESLDAHLRVCAGSGKRLIPIIAKMEVPSAIEHAASIIDAADAIMVARGDLGVELDFAQVPAIQKHLLSLCRDAGIPCVIATQMLQSMIESPTPTRAEASDVANSIFDGADGVMLSGETAVGQYPVEAVAAMNRITRATETSMRTMHLESGGDLEAPRCELPGAPGSPVHMAWTMARESNVRCIVVPSSSGRRARLLSRNNFLLPVLALSPEERVVRRMLLYRGVTPVQVDSMPAAEDMVETAERLVRDRGWAVDGDSILVMADEPGPDGSEPDPVVHRLGSEG